MPLASHFKWSRRSKSTCVCVCVNIVLFCRSETEKDERRNKSTESNFTTLSLFFIASSKQYDLLKCTTNLSCPFAPKKNYMQNNFVRSKNATKLHQNSEIKFLEFCVYV